MRLTLGKFVVHPQHGPAEVVERKTRKVKGEDVEYVVLEVEDQRLQIAVPEDSLSEIGVRDLASHTRLRKLMSLLAKKVAKLPDEQQNAETRAMLETYGKQAWHDIVFVDGTDPEYINQVCDWTEDAEHDDAPDSAACILRVLDRQSD